MDDNRRYFFVHATNTSFGIKALDCCCVFSMERLSYSIVPVYEALTLIWDLCRLSCAMASWFLLRFASVDSSVLGSIVSSVTTLLICLDNLVELSIV